MHGINHALSPLKHSAFVEKEIFTLLRYGVLEKSLQESFVFKTEPKIT